MAAVGAMAELAQEQEWVSTLEKMIFGRQPVKSLENLANMKCRNVSEGLEGPRQTNQRAELTAILRALQIMPKHQSIEIITDSSYSINCCTVWVKSWVKNNWKTSTGKDVENRDLVEAIKILLDGRKELNVETTFTWIKGHDNNPGNEAADRLAVAGAMAGR
jgi:ribonuclease HI